MDVRFGLQIERIIQVNKKKYLKKSKIIFVFFYEMLITFY
jgi:hypothetical protein